MTDSALVGFEPGRLAAQIAIAGAVIAVLALAALIFVRADLNPSQHMISEYAIGGHGWIITVAFFGFAIASAGLLVALTGVVQGPLGWLGLLCLLAAAIGQGMGGAFPMDPTNTAPDAMSFSGRMHGMAFMIGVPGQILAALLLSFALRNQPGWNGALLLGLTVVIWASLGIMGWRIAEMMKDRALDATGLMGWSNRLLMVGYGLWVVVAALPRAR